MATFHADVDPEMQLRVLGCGGDVEIAGHEGTTIDVTGEESLEPYLQHEDNTVTINGHPTSLRIALPRRASVELSGIGGDVTVRSVGELGAYTMTKLRAHSVGGDARLADVAEIELEAIGGDVMIGQSGEAASGASATVKIGHIGGDFRIDRADYLSIRAVGGDAEIGRIERVGQLGHIGGDLKVTLGGSVEGEIRSIVGGDVKLRMPQQPDLTLVAVVGGHLSGSGEEWNIRRGAGRHRLIFGEGRSRMHLMIGGDLEVKGSAAPQQATGFAGHHGEGSADWQDIRGTMEGFGDEMRGFARELEEMGRTLARDLSNLGREIAREVRVAGRETMRDAARGYKAGRYGPGRWPGGPQGGDFGFDPEQIERLKREARAAAAGGISRAQEAIEQALQHWQQSRPGRPTPPRPPAAPPRPPSPSGYTGQTVRIEREEPEAAQTEAAQPANRDAERLAILRMVHEGRLSPDEAEMLLRGLEDRAA
ncbi:MAG TPA: hypothetical protein VFZ66_19750 [Herpetosiphonaceae bacterium]